MTIGIRSKQVGSIVLAFFVAGAFIAAGNSPARAVTTVPCNGSHSCIQLNPSSPLGSVDNPIQVTSYANPDLVECAQAGDAWQYPVSTSISGHCYNIATSELVMGDCPTAYYEDMDASANVETVKYAIYHYVAQPDAYVCLPQIEPDLDSRAYSEPGSSSSPNSGTGSTKVTRKKLTETTPSITGKATVGKKLTAHHGTFNTTGVKLIYQWYLNGKVIKGATKQVVTIKKSWRKHTVTVKITGTKRGWTSISRTAAARRIP